MPIVRVMPCWAWHLIGDQEGKHQIQGIFLKNLKWNFCLFLTAGSCRQGGSCEELPAGRKANASSCETFMGDKGFKLLVCNNKTLTSKGLLCGPWMELIFNLKTPFPPDFLAALSWFVPMTLLASPRTFVSLLVLQVRDVQWHLGSFYFGKFRIKL